MNRRGLLIVISAGSGAGKSTLCRLLVKRRKTLSFSISATTRMPEAGGKGREGLFFCHRSGF